MPCFKFVNTERIRHNRESGPLIHEPAGIRLNRSNSTMMGKIDEGGISYIQGEILKNPGWLQDVYTGDMMTSPVQTEDISSTLLLSLNDAAE